MIYSTFAINTQNVSGEEIQAFVNLHHYGVTLGLSNRATGAYVSAYLDKDQATALVDALSGMVGELP